MFLQGLKLLTALCCIVAAMVQSIELVQNYNLKETIWKKQEEIYHGEMPTPILIFCTDPPDSDHEDIIKHANQTWNNGNRDPGWGVAEIQKMSPPTTV